MIHGTASRSSVISRAVLTLFVVTLAPAAEPLLGQAGSSPRSDGHWDRAWNDLKELPVEFASDTWAVAGAPFRLRGDDAWAFAGVVGAAGLLYLYDGPIQEAAIQERHATPWRQLENVGESLDYVALMGNTNPLWGAGVVLGAITGWDRLGTISQQLLFSHWIAGLTRKAVGLPVGRLRPSRDAGPYEYEPFDGRSFPSGHASTATQVAAVLSHHIDWWPATVLLYGAAGTVVLQRVTSDAHWASDAWLGAAWGWGVARVVIDRRDEDRADFVPFLDPASGRAGLQVRIRH